MKYTELNENTMVTHVPAPWEKDMAEGDFVSWLPSFTGGEYFDLFDRYSYPCEETGDITYYVYDPVKHGTAEREKCPVLVWFHGASNSFNGRMCISHSGGELFASPDYQKKMGGAYVIVPIANEKLDEKGQVIDGWSEKHCAPVRGIIETVINQSSGRTGKIFVSGGSSGGVFSWLITASYPEFIDMCVPISSPYFLTDEQLENIVRNDVKILVAHGRHDELVPFEDCIAPYEEKLKSTKNCICYFPEWVRNGDGGVASLNFGFEMGQHCLINLAQSNFMLDDGTPCDERLPEGLTGWIKDNL